MVSALPASLRLLKFKIVVRDSDELHLLDIEDFWRDWQRALSHCDALAKVKLGVSVDGEASEPALLAQLEMSVTRDLPPSFLRKVKFY